MKIRGQRVEVGSLLFMSVLRIGLRFSDLATSPSPIASPDICFNKLKLHGVQMTHSLLSVILARIFGVEVFFLGLFHFHVSVSLPYSSVISCLLKLVLFLCIKENFPMHAVSVF